MMRAAFRIALGTSLVALVSLPPASAVAPPFATSPAFQKAVHQASACHGKIVKQFVDYTENEGTRGLPTPLFLKDASGKSQTGAYVHCLDTQGNPGSKEHVGIETRHYPDGHVVVVSDRGFLSIINTYQFLLPQDTRPVSDKAYWLHRTSVLLRQLRPQLKSMPIDINKATMRLDHDAGLKSVPMLPHTWILKEDVMTEGFTVELKAITPKQGRALTITASIGEI